MSDIEPEALRVFNSVKEYCDLYNVPQEHFFDILEDQKVIPMIRGKATEFIGAIILKKTLSTQEWSVEKLNLNAQQGTYDEDVSITHKRTGKRLKAETKNAVRGSFRLDSRKIHEPHFKVKCHRSRSNMSKITNDRYEVGDFDVLLSNVSNSIFRGKPMERGLQFIEDADSISWLKHHYKSDDDAELRRCTYDDWRICLPKDIAQDDRTIPRTPAVCMNNDKYWFGLDMLHEKLIGVL